MSLEGLANRLAGKLLALSFEYHVHLSGYFFFLSLCPKQGLQSKLTRSSLHCPLWIVPSTCTLLGHLSLVGLPFISTNVLAAFASCVPFFSLQIHAFFLLNLFMPL